MDKVLAPARAISHPREKRERIFEIDFLRGVAITLMVLLHFCYTLGYGPSDFYGIRYGQEPEWFVAASKLFRFVFRSITQPNGSATGNSELMNAFTNLFISGWIRPSGDNIEEKTQYRKCDPTRNIYSIPNHRF